MQEGMGGDQLLQSQDLTLIFAFQLFHYCKPEWSKTRVRKIMGLWAWD